MRFPAIIAFGLTLCVTAPAADAVPTLWDWSFSDGSTVSWSGTILMPDVAPSYAPIASLTASSAFGSTPGGAGVSPVTGAAFGNPDNLFNTAGTAPLQFLTVNGFAFATDFGTVWRFSLGGGVVIGTEYDPSGAAAPLTFSGAFSAVEISPGSSGGGSGSGGGTGSGGAGGGSTAVPEPPTLLLLLLGLAGLAMSRVTRWPTSRLRA
jgi:hypothetical protein